MRTPRKEKGIGMPATKITVDLSQIGPNEFDASRALRVATVRGGEIIDQKIITPGKEKDPRRFDVELSLGKPEDGVAGAEVVVAPADDERNVLSKMTARKFVAGAEERIVGGVLQVVPGIYDLWRLCWFPRHYRISGRVVRREDDCTHPVAGARVDILDVDYCWWWYNESVITSRTTDVNGFFDITFTWCRPLWCFLSPVIRTPLLVDPSLRDRLRAVLEERVRFPFPPPPPPPDPWVWQKQLEEIGIEVKAPRLLDTPVQTPLALRSANVSTSAVSSKINAAEIFGPILPRFCDDPCDFLPDVKIRVTQTQPSGDVVIYEDTYFDIRFNLASDVTGLTLEANASALYSDSCAPDPILGNCMLLDAVGTTKIAATGGSPLSGIYQPDVTAGVSYGVTPDRNTRLGYVKDYDRPFAGTLDVHGRFGIGAHVDYYQVQVAKWTNADFAAWDIDSTHVPAVGAFGPLPAGALLGFARSYLIEPFNVWPSEPFAPQTVSGIPSLYKSRERFQHEYETAHGGPPAPSFGGWYWYYGTETSLFYLDSSKMANGTYTFRFIGYQQTGVDGMGNPILTPVNMGLAPGVAKRCNTSKAELLTLYLHDDVHTADCEILTFKKNGTSVIDECAMVTLTSADWVEVEYKAFDAAGNLDSYEVTLQKGASSPNSIFAIAGVTAVSGSAPEGPNYGAALAELMTPAVPPDWFGGTWKKKIPYSSFVALGGSCAYNLRLRAWDRHTNGFAAGSGWGATGCDKNRAFTVILA